MWGLMSRLCKLTSLGWVHAILTLEGIIIMANVKLAEKWIDIFFYARLGLD